MPFLRRLRPGLGGGGGGGKMIPVPSPPPSDAGGADGASSAASLSSDAAVLGPDIIGNKAAAAAVMTSPPAPAANGTARNAAAGVVAPPRAGGGGGMAIEKDGAVVVVTPIQHASVNKDPAGRQQAAMAAATPTTPRTVETVTPTTSPDASPVGAGDATKDGEQGANNKSPSRRRLFFRSGNKSSNNSKKAKKKQQKPASNTKKERQPLATTASASGGDLAASKDASATERVGQDRLIKAAVVDTQGQQAEHPQKLGGQRLNEVERIVDQVLSSPSFGDDVVKQNEDCDYSSAASYSSLPPPPSATKNQQDGAIIAAANRGYPAGNRGDADSPVVVVEGGPSDAAVSDDVWKQMEDINNRLSGSNTTYQPEGGIGYHVDDFDDPDEDSAPLIPVSTVAIRHDRDDQIGEDEPIPTLKGEKGGADVRTIGAKFENGGVGNDDNMVVLKHDQWTDDDDDERSEDKLLSNDNQWNDRATENTWKDDEWKTEAAEADVVGEEEDEDDDDEVDVPVVSFRRDGTAKTAPLSVLEELHVVVPPPPTTSAGAAGGAGGATTKAKQAKRAKQASLGASRASGGSAGRVASTTQQLQEEGRARMPSVKSRAAKIEATRTQQTAFDAHRIGSNGGGGGIFHRTSVGVGGVNVSGRRDSDDGNDSDVVRAIGDAALRDYSVLTTPQTTPRPSPSRRVPPPSPVRAPRHHQSRVFAASVDGEEGRGIEGEEEGLVAFDPCSAGYSGPHSPKRDETVLSDSLSDVFAGIEREEDGAAGEKDGDDAPPPPPPPTTYEDDGEGSPIRRMRKEREEREKGNPGHHPARGGGGGGGKSKVSALVAAWERGSATGSCSTDGASPASHPTSPRSSLERSQLSAFSTTNDNPRERRRIQQPTLSPKVLENEEDTVDEERWRDLNDTVASSIVFPTDAIAAGADDNTTHYDDSVVTPLRSNRGQPPPPPPRPPPQPRPMSSRPPRTTSSSSWGGTKKDHHAPPSTAPRPLFWRTSPSSPPGPTESKSYTTAADDAVRPRPATTTIPTARSAYTSLSSIYEHVDHSRVILNPPDPETIHGTARAGTPTSSLAVAPSEVHRGFTSSSDCGPGPSPGADEAGGAAGAGEDDPAVGADGIGMAYAVAVEAPPTAEAPPHDVLQVGDNDEDIVASAESKRTKEPASGGGLPESRANVATEETTAHDAIRHVRSQDAEESWTEPEFADKTQVDEAVRPNAASKVVPAHVGYADVDAAAGGAAAAVRTTTPTKGRDGAQTPPPPSPAWFEPASFDDSEMMVSGDGWNGDSPKPVFSDEGTSWVDFSSATGFPSNGAGPEFPSRTMTEPEKIPSSAVEI